MKENSLAGSTIGMGIKRICFTGLALLIVCHLTACFWFLIAGLEGFHSDTWVVRYGYEDKPTFEVFHKS